MASVEEGLQIQITSRSCEVRQKLTLASTIAEDEDANEDEDGNEEVKDEKDQNYDYHNQIMLNEDAINDLEIMLLIGKSEKPVKFVKVLVENPSHEVLMMA